MKNPKDLWKNPIQICVPNKLYATGPIQCVPNKLYATCLPLDPVEVYEGNACRFCPLQGPDFLSPCVFLDM